jgi:hypothetical protein
MNPDDIYELAEFTRKLHKLVEKQCKGLCTQAVVASLYFVASEIAFVCAPGEKEVRKTLEAAFNLAREKVRAINKGER